MRRGGLLACLLLLIMLSHPSYCAATSELGSECDDMPAAEAIAFGRLRHRANDFAGAVRCLERPAGGDVKAAIYLSESLLRAGDVARAVATLERVIASDPGSRISFAHLLLGRYHLCADGTRVLQANDPKPAGDLFDLQIFHDDATL